MKKIKIKELCEIMGRKRIEELCEIKNWRLPTYKEAIEIEKEYGLSEFWIEGYEEDQGELRPLFYKKGKKFTLSPMFKEKIVIIKGE